MNCDGSVLSELLFGFVHLPDEVDEALARLGHALLRPLSELELADCPRLTVLYHTNHNNLDCHLFPQSQQLRLQSATFSLMVENDLLLYLRYCRPQVKKNG